MKRPSYANYLINDNKEKLTSHPKSFDSTENHLANDATAIHKHSQVTPSEMYLTNTHDIPSCHIVMPIKGQHVTLGLKTSTNDANRMIIDNMNKGTSACMLPRWRTTIRGTTILKTNGTNIDNETNFRILLNKCILVKFKTTSLETSPLEKTNTHIDSTSPQISFDRMCIVSY